MRRTLGFRKVSTFQGVAPLQEEISPVVKPDCTDDEDADDEEKSPSATDDKEVEASLQATPAESVMASDDEFMRVHRSESVPNAVLEWDRDGVSMQTSLRPQGRCQPRCQRTNQQVGWPSKSHIRVADRVSPWLSFPFAGSGLGEIHVFKGKYIYLAELPLPSHDLLISLEGVSWRLNNDVSGSMTSLLATNHWEPAHRQSLSKVHKPRTLFRLWLGGLPPWVFRGTPGSCSSRGKLRLPEHLVSVFLSRLRIT